MGTKQNENSLLDTFYKLRLTIRYSYYFSFWILTFPIFIFFLIYEKKLIHSIEMKKKRQSGEWGPKSVIPPNFNFTGRKHSLESRNKISKNKVYNYKVQKL